MATDVLTQSGRQFSGFSELPVLDPQTIFLGVYDCISQAYQEVRMLIVLSFLIVG